MQRYIVKAMFVDLMDDGYEYKEGDIYPREGLSPSKDRIKELSTTENKRGLVLIAAIDVPEKKPEEVEEVEEAPEEKKPAKKAKKK